MTENKETGKIKKARTNNKGLGKFIRKRRLEKRMSIEKLAEYSDLSDRSISDIERGTRTPKADTLLAICHALDIKTGDIGEFYNPTKTI